MSSRWIAALLIILPLDESLSEGFKLVKERQKVQDPAIKEASGLAASSVDPNFLWVINDSGSTPEIHLTEIHGAARGKIRLKNINNIDWEDLASFSLDGKNYLLIADTGDNAASRASSKIHIIPEPSLPAAGKKLDVTASAAWQIEFTYQGGPRDCESVAVDAAAGKIVLISKRTLPPEVYELPLRAPKKRGIITLKPIGTTEVKSPGGAIIPFYDQPTGLDINASGTEAAIITYYGVFLFSLDPKESWAQAFARPAKALGSHLLGQAESIAFSKNGKNLYAISEGAHSPITTYQK